MANLATYIAEAVKQQGCEKVFGIPGKPLVPLISAIEQQGLDFVLARHEGGAGFMATGYALQNHTLGVAVGTSGPGGTNLLTAAGQAKAFHAPVLFITGHPPLQDEGKALGQDSSFFGTDLVQLFKPLTKFSARIDDVKLLKSYLQHALQNALTGDKGPVHLSIPMDVLMAEVSDVEVPNWEIDDSTISGHLSLVKDKLIEAKRPLLLLGKGVHIANAYHPVQKFAETWQIPVMTTPGGKGAFLTNHPLSLGSFGLGGTTASEAYLKEGVDVMIVVGSKLSDMSTAGLSEDLYPKAIIQFDTDPTFIGKSLPVETLFIKGDARENLLQLNQNFQPAQKLSERDLTKYWLDEQKLRDTVKNNFERAERLSTASVMLKLRELLPAETIVFGDDGSHTFYGIKYFDIVKHGTFYFDDVFGAMGHGLGLAIGAKIAKPQDPIVCLVGDGCLMMHGMELSTAVDQGANVLFIVLNNGMLDMVDKGMKRMTGGKSIGVQYAFGIDATQFAASLGANSTRCKTLDDLTIAVEQGLSAQGPTVIEVLTWQDEVPPTLKRS
ncbi:thiamine pyrophosphate-binding protein [Amphibacillus cookii]|uniref:thiamine pyrophosphate-binding protein n=1 Tax=Amphibacillus cookii TaxID=767787 RepID=UPI00195B1950|nr:thiamine pyrophosphate-binding protein [Amphibacillus cookii]MBM7541035.1 acetolactate synthase-1/2/3 large subunit [Amphibacillus cookii]